MAVLPAEIPTGLVTGQFYFVNEDNVDVDTDPTLTVVTGKVTFTCEAETPLRMPTKDAVIIPLVFEAGFDSQGRLVPKGQTNVGIELPASDSPLFNPTGFTWRVDFDLVDAATGYTIRMDPFSIIVPGGVTSDMVKLMPVSTAPGTIMVQGPKGDTGATGATGPQGAPGTGVPSGGNALDLLRKDATNTATEWTAPTKSLVGLGNVDNTSDVNKPVSTAQQTALNAKENAVAVGTIAQYYRGDKTWQTLDKSAVGLANADNTSDVNKPVSTAQQTALNAKENTITAGTTAQYYRGDKTWQTHDKASVGLGNVDNTSDVNKPISTATQNALNAKIGLVTTFAELQTAVAAGGTIRVGDTPITITATLNVNVAGTKIIGGKFTLPTSAAYPAFSVTASNVTFDLCEFTGAGTTAAYDIDSRFIYAQGTTTNYLTNINVLNCRMVGSQTENMRFFCVRGFTVDNCYIKDFLYAGFLGLSVEEGTISNCTILDGIMKTPVVNVYGIAFSDSANTVALRSRNCKAVGNHIENVQWEGIDTHGGEAIVITGNTVIGCVRGIALVVGNSTRVIVPNMCVVTGNFVDKAGLNDSGGVEREGISLFGLSGNNADAVITGNTVVGYTSANAIVANTAFINPLKTLVEGNSHPHVPWTTLTLDNTTVWDTNATYPPEYMVDGRQVYLRGLTLAKSSSTANSRIGTLPAICKPTRLEFAGVSKGSNSAAGTGSIGVYETGEVWMLYRSTADLYSYTLGCSFERNFTG